MTSTYKNNKPKTLEDHGLLDLMIKDARKLEGIYQPGPYWKNKTKAAVNEIKKFGLSDFRGAINGASTSYADNAFVDIRGNYNFGLRSFFSKIYRDIYPFRLIFDSQVNLTFKYFKEAIDYKNFYLKNNERVKFLLSKYNLNFETCEFGCVSFLEVNGRKISHRYLYLLDTLDFIDSKSSIANKKVFFEIGGGFGANVHLLIELFKFKKIIYLDISPNLYVATQYLKNFYGEKVIDYKRSKGMHAIKFSDTDELEIFCITPDQIEKIDAQIDLFHNADSFIEMPEFVIDNYAKKVEGLLSKNNPLISLVSYSCFDEKTVDPEKLPNFFTKTPAKFLTQTIIPGISNYHFIF